MIREARSVRSKVSVRRSMVSRAALRIYAKKIHVIKTAGRGDRFIDCRRKVKFKLLYDLGFLFMCMNVVGYRPLRIEI